MPVHSAAKLATHLWRGAAQSAANAAHNSASTLRSAFQGTTASGSGAAGTSGSSSASGWASGLSSGGTSAGAGTGGAKYHAGRGAQFTYHNTGRAISQASSSTSNDTNSTRDDDEERRRQKAYQLRLRSQNGTVLSRTGQSVLLSPPNLTAAQMQARFKHVFAANRKDQLTITSGGDATEGFTDTAAPSGGLPGDRRHASSLAASEAEGQSVPHKDPESTSARPPQERHNDLHQKILATSRRKDTNKLLRLVSDYRQLPREEQSLIGFNTALESLLEVGPSGGYISVITATYVQMIENGITPNLRTFSVMIRALCARDAHVQTAANRSNGGIKAAASDEKVDDNFAQALQFMSIVKGRNLHFSETQPYNALLRSCAVRGDVDKALAILSLLDENPLVQSDSETFRALLRTFSNDPNPKPDETPEQHKARKLVACKQVFDEFLAASKESQSFEPAYAESVWSQMVWSHFAMGDPSDSVALVETMLNAGNQSEAHVPPFTGKTASVVIRGFLHIGDLTSALDWFSKLASAGPLDTAPLPDCHTLEELIRRVGQQNSLELTNALNRVSEVYLARADATGWKVRTDTLPYMLRANCAAYDALVKSQSETQAVSHLDKALEFLDEIFVRKMGYLSTLDPLVHPEENKAILHALDLLSNALLRAGRVVDGGSVFTYASAYLTKMQDTFATFSSEIEQLVRTGERFFAVEGKDPAASPTLHLYAAAEFVAPVLKEVNLLDEKFAVGISNLYRLARSEASSAGTPNVVQLPLTSDGWSIVLEAFCFEESMLRPLDLEAFKRDGVAVLLNDLATLPASAEGSTEEAVQLRPNIDVSAALALISKRYGQDGLAAVSAWIPSQSSQDPQQDQQAELLSPGLTEASTVGTITSETVAPDTESQATTPPRSTSPFNVSPLTRQNLPSSSAATAGFAFPPVQVIDTDLGQRMKRLDQAGGQHGAPQAYEDLLDHMKTGVFADPEGLAALMSAFGRLGNVAKVNEIYAMAQHALQGLVGDLGWQSRAWFAVEDKMIQALSHAGSPDAATVHRHRIIAAGGAPSSTAYASLIAQIRETTDDASIAQELFDESQRLGVRPSVYLFNTVISKLSRARKADRALLLFEEMTIKHRMPPTSVTYGAVINACTRIGDEARALQLFKQMESDRHFKPRVPPYNTMIQFYVQSMPSRNRANTFFQKMIAAGVAPSAHTYKLLLDVYGALEPVRPEKMMEVFESLVADPNVSVQGTHWASLINSFGCMLHDLDRAIATFESIATHPSTVSSKGTAKLPDAVAFEALLSVFLVHQRPDLIRTYMEKMKDSGIKMTAYVANMLIRGYALEGQSGLDEARQLFENMLEPAAGVAAVGNHPPRAHGAGAPMSPAQLAQAQAAGVSTGANDLSGVQREPSTYEAMIRAELSHGNRDRAIQLAERMEMRAYPPALVIRARSLIFDEQQHQQEVHQAPSQASAHPIGMHTFAASSQGSPRLSVGGVRHASTAAGARDSEPTSNPAPGPPKPNSPFTIFDRAAKTAQKERAARRRLIETSSDGTQKVGDEASRGEASRLTDYVRMTVAESLAERVQDIKRDYETIVELGAGPGYLRHFLDPKGTGTKKIIMCDTSEAALNRDRHLDGQFPFETERIVLDEEALPFEEKSLDCVVVSGGLHWTNDLPGVLIQIRRALKPDGVLIAGLCGGDTLFELRTSLQLAEQERAGGISPRVSPMADTRDMASLMTRAGFTIPTVDVDEVRIGYPSMYELMHDLRDMGESNAVINRRPMLSRDTMLAAGAIYDALHGIDPSSNESDGMAEGGGVPATFSIIYLIGWSPAPTQPKPLPRGSAKHSLKDALGGAEGDVQQQAEKEVDEEEARKQLQGFMMSIQEETGKGRK